MVVCVDLPYCLRQQNGQPGLIQQIIYIPQKNLPFCPKNLEIQKHAPTFTPKTTKNN